MKALIIVDMQNDFIDGALGTPEAQAIVPNVVNKMKEHKNTDTIILTLFEYLNILKTRKALAILNILKSFKLLFNSTWFFVWLFVSHNNSSISLQALSKCTE